MKKAAGFVEADIDAGVPYRFICTVCNDNFQSSGTGSGSLVVLNFGLLESFDWATQVRAQDKTASRSAGKAQIRKNSRRNEESCMHCCFTLIRDGSQA